MRISAHVLGRALVGVLPEMVRGSRTLLTVGLFCPAVRRVPTAGNAFYCLRVTAPVFVRVRDWPSPECTVLVSGVGGCFVEGWMAEM